MRFLWSWLQEYLTDKLEPEEVVERLNFSGLVVEGAERINPSFEGVIIGEIVHIDRLPDAEKLSFCQVNTGPEKLKIVCGADNIREGQKVPVARVGAKLKSGKVRIEKRKIKGVESEGIMCSEAELDLGEDASGIMILDDTLKPGESLAEVLRLKDFLIELEITSNRPDCFGLFGIAREVSAVFGTELKYPEKNSEEEEKLCSEKVAINIQAQDLCPRYTGKIVLETQANNSPFWMKWRLRNSGIREISAVVDITNYVMLETGQPLHAFDLDLIPEKKVIIRRAFAGERMVTIDGVTRALDPQMLVIADKDKAIAIAGVMGGLSTEVSSTTESVLIESAHFSPASIMRTSRKLGLITEASVRFEKKVDPEGTVYAAERAAYLMQNICGGRVMKGTVDEYVKKHVPCEIKLRHPRIEKVVGKKFVRRKVIDIFKPLGFDIREEKENYILKVPSFRPDVQREIDLIEEVARIYGYDRLPSTIPKNNTYGGYSKKGEFANSVREIAVRQGFFEAVTFSLVSERFPEMFYLGKADKLAGAKPIVNPVSGDLSRLRTSLVPGLMDVLRNNFSRGVKSLRIFEVGKVFFEKGSILPEEELKLGFGAMGELLEKSWYSAPIKNDFFALKGLIEEIFREFKVEVILKPSNIPFLSIGKQASVIVNKQEIGYFGEVLQDICRRYDIKQPAYAGEMSLDLLFEVASYEKIYQEVPVYPAISYDISILILSEICYLDVKKAILGLQLNWLEDVFIFDLYIGKEIPAGKKSIALRVVFRSKEKTLSESEVKPDFERIISLLKERFSAEIRGSFESK